MEQPFEPEVVLLMKLVLKQTCFHLETPTRIVFLSGFSLFVRVAGVYTRPLLTAAF